MQNPAGYRFSIDAILLAAHACPNKDDTVVDLGAGCGIISIILAYRYPAIRVFGVEIQKELADIASLNVTENRMDDRVVILNQDMKTLSCDMVSGPVQMVVSNPPYRKIGSGRINPNKERAVARHEIHATLADVIKVSSRILETSGRFIIVYPTERIVELLCRMHSANIEPKYIRMIHSYLNTDSKLILVEGIKAGQPGIRVFPPVIIYNEHGGYTDELRDIFAID